MIAETTNIDQIYQRADQSIAEARNQLAEVADRIDQIQHELDTLAQAHGTRHTTLDLFQNPCSKL